MSKLHFVVKPNLWGAVFPYFVRWFWRFLIASTIVYWFFRGLLALNLVAIDATRLLISLIVLTPVLAVVFVKHHAIRLHNTKYLFYDSHVVEEYKFIIRKRHSVPFAQITRVKIRSNIWNRISGTDDIHLKSADSEDENDLLLRSVKDAHSIEHRIYKLLQSSKGDSTLD